MANAFRCRKLCHRLLEIIRELFVGKMAAVVVAWVLKNALFYTIIIGKAGTLGVSPKTLLAPEYIESHGLAFMGYSFTTFVMLLLVAAYLAYLVTQGGWSGFMKQSVLQQELGDAGGLGLVAGVVDIRQTTHVLTEMSNFYAAGLVFIPAWAYKDFLDRSREYFTFQYEETATETVINGTGSLANQTGNVAGQIGIVEIINSGVDFIKNMTGVGGNASDNAESDDIVIEEVGNDIVIEEVGNDTNFINVSDLEVVVKIEDAFEQFQHPTTWWLIFCFLVATCVAATVQVIAHTAVDTLPDGRWDYLKQVFKSLETCMGLGTGGAFWAVFCEIFETHPFSWLLRSVYTIGITVLIVASQIVLRTWLARSPNRNKFCVGAVKFVDKAYDFVVAWAWQEWLVETLKPGLDSLISSGDECSLLYNTHFFVRACQITLLCVAVNAALDVFKEKLKVITPEIRQTALLVTGINAGWAWMFFAKSFFGCGSEIQYNALAVWGLTFVIIAGTLAVAFTLDYVNHKVDSYVQDLRKEAGTLDDKDDDSYWRQYDSSQGSDSDDSDDGSEDLRKPAR